MGKPSVSWDPKHELAMFQGPGGFTQIFMTQRQAEAIATALGVPFYVSKPGTSLSLPAGYIKPPRPAQR